MGRVDRIGQFSGRGKYVALESYKKSGEPKLTPVLGIESNGIIYFRTGARKWKVKRIRENPLVRLVPCDGRATPSGVWTDGEAHILEGKDREHAAKLFKKEFGEIGDLLRRAAYRLFRGEAMSQYVAIRLL
jgi:PPOX class probable F420-dependent enzyme